MCHEATAGRGAIQVVFGCLYKHMQITRSNVTYVIFPDTCWSQNKNSSVSAVCETVYYLL